LTGKARVAGVMGWPISHSRSPRLHGWWLRHYGIDGAYVPFAVPPDRAQAAIRALPALGLKGCNVTVPHKEVALATVDRVDDAARLIGAVNTIVVQPDGLLEGRNTDAFGFRECLMEGAPGWSAAAGAAVVVGAGGAARAVVVALLQLGVSEIRLVNRTLERAEALAGSIPGPLSPIAWDRRGEALEGAGLLVNTTTQGMVGQPPLELALHALPRSAVVLDIVYTPLVTPLLAAAAARGNPTVDGLGMLLHQARPGFEAWFGVAPAVTPALRRHMLEGL
jgi:shikimate dehydrogenase